MTVRELKEKLANVDDNLEVANGITGNTIENCGVDEDFDFDANKWINKFFINFY